MGWTKRLQVKFLFAYMFVRFSLASLSDFFYDTMKGLCDSYCSATVVTRCCSKISRD